MIIAYAKRYLDSTGNKTAFWCADESKYGDCDDYLNDPDWPYWGCNESFWLVPGTESDHWQWEDDE